jgi:hypothetical protein
MLRATWQHAVPLGELNMYGLRLFVAAAALALSLSTASQAQALFDMSRYSCAQLTGANSSSNAVTVAIWLSGYYNGGRKNTMLDLDQLEQNAKVVVSDCQANPSNTVMKTIDALMAAGKVK